MEATYQNGVLTLTIPVAEQAKPRKVQVTSGDEQPQALEANADDGSDSQAVPATAGATKG